MYPASLSRNVQICIEKQAPKGEPLKNKCNSNCTDASRNVPEKHPKTCNKSLNQNVAKSTSWRLPETLCAADNAKNT
jgi:hypothetical protein